MVHVYFDPYIFCAYFMFYESCIYFNYFYTSFGKNCLYMLIRNTYLWGTIFGTSWDIQPHGRPQVFHSRLPSIYYQFRVDHQLPQSTLGLHVRPSRSTVRVTVNRSSLPSKSRSIVLYRVPSEFLSCLHPLVIVLSHFPMFSLSLSLWSSFVLSSQPHADEAQGL